MIGGIGGYAGIGQAAQNMAAPPKSPTLPIDAVNRVEKAAIAAAENMEALADRLCGPTLANAVSGSSQDPRPSGVLGYVVATCEAAENTLARVQRALVRIEQAAGA